MPVFMNPFAKHDVSDFPDTYVPLANAQRNASVVADHDAKIGGLSVDAKGVENGDNHDYSAYTIEGLRAEIDMGTLG